jgi:NDP-sugar pyrophosphorylase family protein
MKHLMALICLLSVSSTAMAQTTVTIGGQSISCDGSLVCSGNACKCSDGIITELEDRSATSNILIDPSARVASTVKVGNGSKILGASMIWGRTVIGANSIITNSFIVDSVIGANSIIDRANIRNSSVGSNANLKSIELINESIPSNETRVGQPPQRAN